MTTSGSTDFNLEFTDIAEEAFERAGREMRSGYDLRTARRSMNLLTIEWANRGINMWTIKQGSINLVQGTATYNLPDDTIDLLEHVLGTGAGNSSTQADLTIPGFVSPPTPQSQTNFLKQDRYRFTSAATPALHTPQPAITPPAHKQTHKLQFGLSLTKVPKALRITK